MYGSNLKGSIYDKGRYIGNKGEFGGNIEEPISSLLMASVDGQLLDIDLIELEAPTL